MNIFKNSGGKAKHSTFFISVFSIFLIINICLALRVQSVLDLSGLLSERIQKRCIFLLEIRTLKEKAGNPPSPSSIDKLQSCIVGENSTVPVEDLSLAMTSSARLELLTRIQVEHTSKLFDMLNEERSLQVSQKPVTTFYSLFSSFTLCAVFLLVYAERNRVFALIKSVESGTARYRVLLHSSPTATVTINTEGIVVGEASDGIPGWNPAAEKMLGWSKVEMESKLFADLIIPAGDREEFEILLLSIKRGEPHFSTKFSHLRVRPKDGVRTVLDISLTSWILEGKMYLTLTLEKSVNHSSSGAPRHILVVDDNDETALLLQMTLKLSGYMVSTASSGTQALDLLEVGNFNLVILDHSMPDLTGAAVAKIIRDTKNLNTQIVFFTGTEDEEVKETGFPIWKKPLSGSDVVERVNALLN